MCSGGPMFTPVDGRAAKLAAERQWSRMQANRKPGVSPVPKVKRGSTVEPDPEQPSDERHHEESRDEDRQDDEEGSHG